MVVYVAEKSLPMAQAVARETGADKVEHYGPHVARSWTARPQDLVFIGAMGICVRLIAPVVRDKHADPAVVCVDSAGQFAVSVMSGHLGGANERTRRVARILGARPVITTQSDAEGLLRTFTLSADKKPAVAILLVLLILCAAASLSEGSCGSAS